MHLAALWAATREVLRPKELLAYILRVVNYHRDVRCLVNSGDDSTHPDFRLIGVIEGSTTHIQCEIARDARDIQEIVVPCSVHLNSRENVLLDVRGSHHGTRSQPYPE